MKMGYGLWIAILGILGIIVGGAMYADNYHKTIGTGGLVLGVILIIIGVALMMMKPKGAAKPVAPQPTQSAKSP